MLRIVTLILAIVVMLFVAATYWVSRPAFNETRQGFSPTIADPAEAYTFARTAEGLVYVTAHDGDALKGVNLTRLLGEASTNDFSSVVSALDAGAMTDEGEETFPLNLLQNPFDYQYPYIAAGTNFKEHAEEVYSNDPPFLFPKLVAAGDWNDKVPYRPRLDFEAELCMFPLSDIRSKDDRPRFGLVLCNDFTDRWTLIKEMKLSKPLGLTGFAAGKGCPGCMPTGYLVVIPRSPVFYLSLNVSLYVNDKLRQNFAMKDLILPIEDLIAQAFEKRGESYAKGDETVSLMPAGYIPKGTLILTGTAAGVILKPLNIWKQSFYLAPGDVVRTEATFLGHLENTVVEEVTGP